MVHGTVELLVLVVLAVVVLEEPAPLEQKQPLEPITPAVVVAVVVEQTHLMLAVETAAPAS